MGNKTDIGPTEHSPCVEPTPPQRIAPEDIPEFPDDDAKPKGAPPRKNVPEETPSKETPAEKVPLE